MDLSVPYNVPSLFRISLLADLCIFRRISTPWLCVCTITQLSRRLSAFIFLSAPADSLGGLQSQRVIFYLMTSLMSCNDLHGISLTLHHVMIYGMKVLSDPQNNLLKSKQQPHANSL